MLHLIDRRPNGRGKSAVNRERFLRRYKAQIESAVKKMVGERRFADMEQGGEVRVPKKDISEPSFGFGRGGDREFVLPGNREYVAGDRIPRPDGAGSGGGNGSAGGEGDSEDAFVFSLSREEFMQIFFDDLELPHLARTELGRTERKKSVRAGYTQVGRARQSRRRPHAARSRSARRIALARRPRARGRGSRGGVRGRGRGGQRRRGRASCYDELARLAAPPRRLPFLDEPDLRYRNRVWRPEPIARAAMFCLMDVSASMDEDKKDLAKRFFTLLYLFLTRKYGEVDLVFIRHTDDAEEVDEDTFFHDTRSGGTVVLFGARARGQDPRRALRERLERLRGAGLRRRRLRRRPGAERALPAREAAAGHALLHLSRARRAAIRSDHASTLWAEYERVAEATDNFAMRRATRARARSTRCSASCSSKETQ